MVPICRAWEDGDDRRSTRPSSESMVSIVTGTRYPCSIRSSFASRLADGVGVEHAGIVADRRGVRRGDRGRQDQRQGEQPSSVEHGCWTSSKGLRTVGSRSGHEPRRPTGFARRASIYRAPDAVHAACRMPGRRGPQVSEISPNRATATTSSRRQEHAGPVAADAEAGGVVHVDLAGGGAVAEVVEVGVAELQELRVEPDEGPQADVGRRRSTTTTWPISPASRGEGSGPLSMAIGRLRPPVAGGRGRTAAARFALTNSRGRAMVRPPCHQKPLSSPPA